MAALLLEVSAVELGVDGAAEAEVSGIVCSVVGGASSPEFEQPTTSVAVRTVARDSFVIRITVKCNE